MDPIRTLIVDDEPLARDRLRRFLKTEEDVELIGECDNGVEAITVIQDTAPDLVFLDMQMPGCNGLQVLAQLPKERRPAIVFATAHEGYAVDAFDVAALDYLLKPFDGDRFQQTLQRVRERLQQQRNPATRPTPGVRSDRITMKADGRLVFLRPEEIKRIEAADNYATLHLVTGRLMVRETMASIEARLDNANFGRINRSAIVNLDQIKEIRPAQYGDYLVLLRDGTELPLSRKFRGRLERFTGRV
jgi:two-component system LytT family response regulator